MSTKELITKTKRNFLCMALIFGFVQAISTRSSVFPDGVSYLDIGLNYFNGNFEYAINSYWSPLYSLIIGSLIFLFKPSMSFEGTFVHIINFFCFIFSYFCFQALLNEVILYQKLSIQKKENQGFVCISEISTILIGNSLFLWTSFNLIKISYVSPDMILSGLIYLIFAVFYKQLNGNNSYKTFLFFGLILGLSYLTKTFMFPFGILILICNFIYFKKEKNIFLKILITMFVFIFISSPFIYLISKKEGHVTFGETGKLNIEWFLNKTYFAWREGSPGSENVLNPAKKIFSMPDLYEYSKPVKGSYPIWYDPSYWHRGQKINFSLIKQLNAIHENAIVLFNEVFYKISYVLLGLVFLFLTSGRKNLIKKDLKEFWFIFLLTSLGVFCYLMIVIYTRYIGAFILVFLLALFSMIKFKNNNDLVRIQNFTVILISAFLIIMSAASEDMLTEGRNDTGITHYHLAEKLNSLETLNGKDVGAIGLSYGIYWAHLARVKVIAEIDEDKKLFWASDLDIQNKVIEKYREIGAKAIIAEDPPKECKKHGWVSIEGIPYAIYIF